MAALDDNGRVTSRRPVQAAIAELRTALERVDRRGHVTDDRVRRGEAEALLASLSTVPVAILVANAGAHYVDANRAAALLTGYTRRQLLRMSVWDLTPERNRDEGLAQWRRFLQDGEMSGKYRIRCRNGRVQTATFVALANVMPGLHVSALATPTLVRALARRRRKAGTNAANGARRPPAARSSR